MVGDPCFHEIPLPHVGATIRHTGFELRGHVPGRFRLTFPSDPELDGLPWSRIEEHFNSTRSVGALVSHIQCVREPLRLILRAVQAQGGTFDVLPWSPLTFRVVPKSVGVKASVVIVCRPGDMLVSFPSGKDSTSALTVVIPLQELTAAVIAQKIFLLM
jgi:hypothetical protein